MLLLPAWTASKTGWRQFLHTLAMIRNGNTSATLEDAAASRLGNDLEERAGVCYVCPGDVESGRWRQQIKRERKIQIEIER